MIQFRTDVLDSGCVDETFTVVSVHNTLFVESVPKDFNNVVIVIITFNCTVKQRVDGRIFDRLP